jgi:uncharacterized protein (TIGR02147 family)
MPQISEYTDYRKFLKDYYEETRKTNPRYSFELFSRKAGIKSRGFLHNVIKGTRNLSTAHVFGLVQAMKLDKHETEYFENLVAFNQAADSREKHVFYSRLSAIKNNGIKAWKPQLLRRDQFEFYSQMLHSTIRSLIGLYGFKDDYAWLAKSVIPNIKPLQAKKSVALLERLGLITKNKNGQYTVTDKSIASPKEVTDVALLRFHEQTGQHALEALKNLPRDKRNFSSMTLGVSKKTYDEICEDIYAIRQKILQKAEADDQADSVYQLNFQLFPVASVKKERNSK